MNQKRQIKNALISVFHKDGLGPVVNKLNNLGIEIYSTGGTRNFIEDQGITVECKRRLTEKVFIPMKGYNDSLNVSSAAAIVLYESNRQREGN